MAPAKGTTKAPTMKDFRGSIPWLSGSLPTYHARVTPLTAQGSLPGAGQALLGGLLPAGLLQKVSNSPHVRLPPSPSFLAQSPFLPSPDRSRKPHLAQVRPEAGAEAAATAIHN